MRFTHDADVSRGDVIQAQAKPTIERQVMTEYVGRPATRMQQ